MKLILKNAKLIFRKAIELYCGIFTPSETRVNKIVKDGCAAENDFFTEYSGSSTYCSRSVEQIENGTKLTYVDVFANPSALYNGGYYSTPFCIVPCNSVAQKQTIGVWVKIASNISGEFMTGAIGSTFTGPTGFWSLTKESYTNSYTGTLCGSSATINVSSSAHSLSDGTWVFVQFQVIFSDTPASGWQLMLCKNKATDESTVGLKIITANWTWTDDEVTLDPMTYYPAAGHNPQKDPSADE